MTGFKLQRHFAGMTGDGVNDARSASQLRHRRFRRDPRGPRSGVDCSDSSMENSLPNTLRSSARRGICTTRPTGMRCC